ncbi:hypothetical protein J6590_011235 [Homalodisca vitripennis]|nr:hypothetical protein J6590_011235 [Homalodisca vitripennis]
MKNAAVSKSTQGASVVFIQYSYYSCSPRESFNDFIRRFKVFIRLRGNTDHTLKVQALTHHIHEQLYNVCTPNSPLPKTYYEIIKILTSCIDPKRRPNDSPRLCNSL